MYDNIHALALEVPVQFLKAKQGYTSEKSKKTEYSLH
jgi:hypothetical protein